MRIVTVIAEPLTRSSSGSSTARVSGRVVTASAVRWLAGRRAVTLPIVRCSESGSTTALETGVFDLAAVWSSGTSGLVSG